MATAHMAEDSQPAKKPPLHFSIRMEPHYTLRELRKFVDLCESQDIPADAPVEARVRFGGLLRELRIGRK